MTTSARSWTFLTNHARVLLAIDGEPGLTVREIAERAGVTEREVYTVLNDLEAAGYLSRRRNGRRSELTLLLDGPMRPPIEGRRVRHLAEALRVRSAASSSG
jgi:DNA-binding MarR family transcriptional regulator